MPKSLTQNGRFAVLDFGNYLNGCRIALFNDSLRAGNRPTIDDRHDGVHKCVFPSLQLLLKAVLQSYVIIILGAAGHNKQDNFLLPLIGFELRWQIEGLFV